LIPYLSELDAEFTRRLCLVEQPGFLRTIFGVFAHSGDSWLLFTASGLMWWIGPLEWKSLSAIMLLSMIGLAVLVAVIKFTVRRQRPAGDWGNIYRKTDPHSFPSGHAARVSLLVVLALALGPIWFGLLVLIWALLVTFARVAMGVHYLSDVLAGSVLGVLVGFLVLLII
jgi:undecaprenyl-diphosphatase